MEVVVTYFKILSWVLPGGTEGTVSASQDRQHPNGV